VVTPIGTVRSKDGEFKIGNGGPGTQTEDLRSALVGIQRGAAADKHSWLHKVF
jgi:branched-chain amino acid aminotransferase